MSAFIYFATSLVPTKVFFGLFIFCLFTVPYYYEEHQDTIDEKLTVLVEKSKILVGKYSTIVRRNSATIYTQSVAMVQQKMRQNKKTTTMEEE